MLVYRSQQTSMCIRNIRLDFIDMAMADDTMCRSLTKRTSSSCQDDVLASPAVRCSASSPAVSSSPRSRPLLAALPPPLLSAGACPLVNEPSRWPLLSLRNRKAPLS